LGSLDKFDGRTEILNTSENINHLYPGALKRAVNVDDEVNMVYGLLHNEKNVSFAIIGKSGVGKTTWIHEATYQYISKLKNNPQYSHNQIWHVDPNRVVAGMSIVGQWQRRFQSIIKFVINPSDEFKIRKDKLLFTNVVALFRVGKTSQNNMTLADILKPYIEKKEVQVIIEATFDQWVKAREINRSFCDLFHIINCHEPDYEKALPMITAQVAHLEESFRVGFTTLSLLKCFDLYRTYYRDKAMPGVILDMLSHLASKYNRQTIDDKRVVAEFQEKTKLNPTVFDTNVGSKYDKIKYGLQANLIGQQKAVKRLTETVFVYSNKLNNPDKPIGTFLFIGPTGVGKTEAAKALTKYLYQSEDNMIRFDMNEYIDSYSVNRLIGDDYHPEGLLTMSVRFNPFCVLLFDEIEKAHPLIHNMLLQVLDEGRLTDANGQTVSFTNTIIILTSNLGAADIGKSISWKKTDESEQLVYEKAMRNFFKPEFINRITDVIVFDKLKVIEIQEIAKNQIYSFFKREGFIRRRIYLDISHYAVDRIAEDSYDSEFGARTLKRGIERTISKTVADLLSPLPLNKPVYIKMIEDRNTLKTEVFPIIIAESNPDFWLPKIDANHNKLKQYEWLLGIVDKILLDMLDFQELSEIDINANIENNNPVNVFFRMKDKAKEYQETIEKLINAYELKYLLDNAGREYTVKKLEESSIEAYKKDWDGGMLQLKSKNSIRRYLNKLYSSAISVIEANNADFYKLYLGIILLNYQWKHLEKNMVDRIAVVQNSFSIFVSCIIKSLFANKCTIHHTTLLEGYGIYSILKNEMGNETYDSSRGIDFIHILKVDQHLMPCFLNILNNQSDRVDAHVFYSEYVHLGVIYIDNKHVKINKNHTSDGLCIDYASGMILKQQKVHAGYNSFSGSEYYNYSYPGLEAYIVGNLPKKYKFTNPKIGIE